MQPLRYERKESIEGVPPGLSFPNDGIHAACVHISQIFPKESTKG